LATRGHRSSTHRGMALQGGHTLYEVLKLDAEASDKDIKKAYRKLVVAHHPDKDRSEGAVERFQAIQSAFDVLSDPVRRLEYDEALASGCTDAPASDAPHDRATPVMLAAEAGEAAQVAELLAKGARVDQCDSFDRSALMYAAWAGQPEALDVLLKAEADINLRDSEGMTPFLFAAGGKKRILELSPGTMRCLRVLLDARSDVNASSIRGFTALSMACKAGSPTATGFLLSKGANPDQEVAGNSLSPLCSAAHRGHVKILELLIAGRADPSKADSDGETALMTASGAGHEAAVNLLIDAGANARANMQDGVTALLCVVEEFADGRIGKPATEAIVKRLLSKGAEPLASSIDGRTPLKVAAKKKGAVWLEDLLSDAANKKTSTCLDCLAGFKIMFS